jgi:hypothetical protein
MARTEPDALLSLQRYFGLVLPDPWDVRTDLEPGLAPERPWALVTRNATVTSGPPGSLLVTMAATVHAYLPRAESAAAARDAELAMREVLWQSVEWGVPPARHRRLPLWDFDPPAPRRVLDDDGRPVPFRAHCDFLRVDSDPQINSVPDADDPLLVMVALDLRCTFRRGQPVPSGQMILQRIGAGPALPEG